MKRIILLVTVLGVTLAPATALACHGGGYGKPPSPQPAPPMPTPAPPVVAPSPPVEVSTPVTNTVTVVQTQTVVVPVTNTVTIVKVVTKPCPCHKGKAKHPKHHSKVCGRTVCGHSPPPAGRG